MATKKEQLQEEQKQILIRVDFLRRAMIKASQKNILDMYQGKIDDLLDQYNQLQNEIDAYGNG